jgi:acetyl esterase/lipase
MQRLLEAWSAFRGRPLEGLTAAEARAQPSLQTAVDVVLKKQGKSVAPQSVAKVESRLVPGAEGDLTARVYTPAGEGPFPVLVYFHGGGWVLGGIEDYDASARALANAAGCVVVSVGYRQAPEHPYPAAVKDASAAFSYISKNAGEFGGDSRRVAVGGEGSGANLAAVVCMMAMEQRSRMPVHQLLICPITNFAFDTPSYRRNANARPYSKAGMQWFFKQYLSKRGQAKSPYVSILKKSLVDLPPATVIVAELDPLRSEGEAYHKHLLAGAVDSQIGIYSGVTADFFGTGRVVAKAKKAANFAGRRLHKSFTINRPY